MTSVSTYNYCDKLQAIPQFSGTCWFNAILMVMLYSQGFRKELSKILKKAKKSKEDKLFNFILYVLRNYNNIEKLTKLYEDFNNMLLQPDHLLISYLKLYDKILLTRILNDLDFGHFSYYINKILTNYNIPYLSITHHNNNLFAENNKTLDFDNINIVFIEHNITTYKIDYVLNEEYHNIDNIIEKLCSNCNDLKNKKDIIVLNGHLYKLDSCLIRPIHGGHVISGITCNNQQYLIDSINKKYLEKTINSKKYKKLLTPCKPILYNWSISSKICISDDCTINPGKIDDKLCYDLDKSFVTFIYIKLTNNSPIKFNENSLISKDFKYNKEELSLYVKTLIPDLLNKNTTELTKIISNIYVIETINYLKEHITTKYFLFYEKLVNKPLNILIDKELLLKDIYIQLIYKYYKKHILYNIYAYAYADDNIYHIIYMLSLKNEENLNKIKSEYNEIIIKSNINNYTEYILKLYALNIDNIYNILFIKYKAFYDKKIIELNYEDKSRELIVKLLILKEFFKKKYLIIFKEIIDTINKYITNIIYSISFIISTDNYKFNFITIIAHEYAEKIYKEYFENNKDFYDNEIISTYKELIGTEINKETYINIKLLILEEYFNKEYNEIINKYKLIIFKKYYNNKYTKEYNNIIESVIKDYIKKYSFISIEKLLIKYIESEYYEDLIILNLDEIYYFLFNNKIEFFDRDIKNNKNNKNNIHKQIIIKLLILKECFNINYNKKLQEINYKRETGKEMRSRTSSSRKKSL